jgi:Uri superfamily endonuclease
MKSSFNLTNFLCATMPTMLAKIIHTIPQQPGSYALWLHLSQSQNLAVGKLGDFTFPAGDYVYLGSARGPGGLRARLGRHLWGGRFQRKRKIRWHIDYLRAAAQVRGFGSQIYRRGIACSAPTECAWSQKLAALPKSRIVAPRFGASDCQSGCAAHLVYFPSLDEEQISNSLDCQIQILSSE